MWEVLPHKIQYTVLRRKLQLWKEQIISVGIDRLVSGAKIQDQNQTFCS